MSVERVLKRLRREIHDLNAPERPHHIQRFDFLELGGHFYLEFYGDPWGDAYAKMLSTISCDPVAPRIAALRIGGPDCGANGTKNWDLRQLASSPARFTKLHTLHIQQSEPADHNRAIVGEIYDEGGVLAAIAKKSPQLTTLTTPSAPNGAFSRTPLRKLACLNVDAGFATQDFIFNLSQSSGFPNLRFLAWGEYREAYMDGWRDHCTPFAHYQALFRSKAFLSVSGFVLKNPVCSAFELAELKSIRPDVQIHVVRWESAWLSS